MWHVGEMMQNYVCSLNLAGMGKGEAFPLGSQQGPFLIGALSFPPEGTVVCVTKRVLCVQWGLTPGNVISGLCNVMWSSSGGGGV